MKILQRRETWIHTHFLTDSVRLPSARMRQIKAELEPVLRKLGIVYGIHFEEGSKIRRGGKEEKGLRIVLECIPFPSTLEHIQNKLQDIWRIFRSSQFQFAPAWLGSPSRKVTSNSKIKYQNVK